MVASHIAGIQRLVERKSWSSWYDESKLIETKIGQQFYHNYENENRIKLFSSTSKADALTVGRKVLPTQSVRCTACKETHTLWSCPVFRGKTPTQRAKIVADNKVCFSCLNGQHFFRQYSKPRKCTSEVCSNSQNLLLHRTEKVFPSRPLSWKNNATKSSSVPVKKKSREARALFPQIDLKCLLQTSEFKLESPTRTERVLALCDSACSR